MNLANALSRVFSTNQQDWSRSLIVRFFDSLVGGTIHLSQEGYPTLALGEREEQAEVQIEIQVQDPAVFSKILRGGSVAAGETYIQDGWRCSNLHGLLQLMVENQDRLDSLDSKLHWVSDLALKLRHFSRRNHKKQAKKNILAHYDLGNDFYQSFLDPRMQYSSAIFAHPDMSLEQAQEAKLKRICEQLELCPADHLLEIGTGWGGLAVYAAENYGCKVTTTTISDRQFQYACAQVKERGLDKLVTVLCKDYRELSGVYDKLVSIEMIEAVGERYLDGFFERCQAHLRTGGLMLLQAITIADSRFERYRNGVDFIQEFVFPGGFLPSSGLLQQLSQAHGLQTTQTLEIGKDYAQTLALWHQRVEAYRSQHGNGFGKDDAFYRLWHFYFAYCEAGFRSANTGTQQLTLRKQ